MIPGIRFWDKARKCLVTNESEGYGFDINLDSSFSVTYREQRGDDPKVRDYCCDSKDFIPMRGTGVVDKTGAELFDEDIIDFEGSRAVIKWDYNAAMFYFHVLNYDTWCDDWNFQDDASRSKIIGCSYANQESKCN